MATRLELEKKYKATCSNLLFLAVLSLVNTFLVVIEADLSFYFSALFPPFSIIFFKELAADLGLSVLSSIGIALSFGSLLFCFVCYFLAKKHSGALVAALIFFCLDTLLSLWVLSLAFEFFTIATVAIHVWIIVILISGLRAKSQLDKLPPDDLLAGAVQSVGDAPAEAVDAVSPEQED